MRGQSFAAPNYDSTKQQLTLESQLFEAIDEVQNILIFETTYWIKNKKNPKISLELTGIHPTYVFLS